MKERSILFSTSMVLALLNGSKTQTRRIIKPQPDPDGLWNHSKHPMYVEDDKQGFWGQTLEGESRRFKCLYGEVGDRLWVKETFAYQLDTDGDKAGVFAYKADDPLREIKPYFSAFGGEFSGIAGNTGWQPSIYMPRALSRITLELTDISVERVADISEADAKAEGVDRGWYLRDTLDGEEKVPTDYKHGFHALWNKLHGAESWVANPFVWVLKFKRVIP